MTDQKPQARTAGRNLAAAAAVLVACAAWCPARAEPPPSSAPNSLLDDYALRQWTVEDGLPERAVQCVEEGPDGFFWVATFRHLLRFDGIRFVDAGSPGNDFDGDPGERILKMHAAADRRVYLLTTECVRCYGPGGWSRLLRRSPDEMPDEWRTAMLTGDSRGAVHLSGGSGIVTFRDGAIAAPDAGATTLQWTVVGGVPHAIIGGDLDPRPVPDHDGSEPTIQLSVCDDAPTAPKTTAITAPTMMVQVTSMSHAVKRSPRGLSTTTVRLPVAGSIDQIFFSCVVWA
jgi:hypothetical protein